MSFFSDKRFVKPEAIGVCICDVVQTVILVGSLGQIGWK